MTGVVSCIDGVADIATDGAVLRVVDDCEKVYVAALGAVVLAPAVGTIEVSGTASVVVVGSADRVDVVGLANDVVWESGSPRVSDIGTLNRVLPAAGR